MGDLNPIGVDVETGAKRRFKEDDNLVALGLNQPVAINNNPDRLFLFEDWISPTPSGALGWSEVNSGIGAIALIFNILSTVLRALGAVELTTGTAITGRSSLTLGSNNILLDGARFDIRMRLYVPVLANVSEDFVIRMGLHDNTGSGDATNGIYFEYNRAISNNWRIATARSGSRTKTTTSVAVQDDDYSTFLISINNSSNNVSYFIDGVEVGNITTNIPDGSGPTLKIEKTAGLTSRSCIFDYFSLEAIYNDTNR